MSIPTADEIRNPDYWRKLCPELTIGDTKRFRKLRRLKADKETAASLRELFIREGYIHLPPEHVSWQVDLEAMAACVSRVHEQGLLPLFTFLFDDFWLVYRHLGVLVSQLLGEEAVLFPTEVYTWFIPCRDDAGGWEMHRDHGPSSLDKDDQSTSLSVWIPLTDATALNGCMSCLPRHLDPHYTNRRQRTPKVPNPEHIRPLPGKRGSFFCWDSCLLHWGGSSSARATEPRISLVMEYQKKSVAAKKPIMPLVRSTDWVPSFEDRIKLLATQLHFYFERHGIDEDWKLLALELMPEEQYQFGHNDTDSEEGYHLDGVDVKPHPKYKRVHAPVKYAEPVPLADGGEITELKKVLGLVPADADKDRDKDPGFMYVVECADGSLYTGWSVNVAKRVEKHNSGKGAKYTRSRLPVKLVACWRYDCYSDAMKAEAAFKKLSRKRKQQAVAKPSRWVKHYGSGTVEAL